MVLMISEFGCDELEEDEESLTGKKTPFEKTPNERTGNGSKLRFEKKDCDKNVSHTYL